MACKSTNQGRDDNPQKVDPRRQRECGISIKDNVADDQRQDGSNDRAKNGQARCLAEKPPSTIPTSAPLMSPARIMARTLAVAKPLPCCTFIFYSGAWVSGMANLQNYGAEVLAAPTRNLILSGMPEEVIITFVSKQYAAPQPSL